MPHLSWWQLSKRFLDSKLFWPDIYLNRKFIKTTNFLDQILLWTHNLLEPTFFWTHKFLYQKLFWPQKNFTSKHFLDPTFFCTLKIFWTKISLDQFFLKPTIFSPQFFSPKIFSGFGLLLKFCAGAGLVLVRFPISLVVYYSVFFHKQRLFIYHA